MPIDRTLVLATRNKGKIAEFKSLLSRYDINIKSLKDFAAAPSVEEDGVTFEDNAIKKARTLAKFLNLPALSDDSGLMVEALGGMPGVYSARFAGEGSSDEENNAKLLRVLNGIEERAATFKCVVAMAVPEGSIRIFEGTCDGLVTHRLEGDQGFGYDPLFYYPPSEKTFAQMSKAEKNKVSHRGQATAKLVRNFDQVLAWLEEKL